MKIEARLHKSLSKEDAKHVRNAHNIVTSLYPKLFEITVERDCSDFEDFRKPVKGADGSFLGRLIAVEEILEYLMSLTTSPIVALFTNEVFYSKTDQLFPILAYLCDLDKQTGSFVLSVEALWTTEVPVFERRIAVNIVHSIGIITLGTRCNTPGCPLNYHVTVREMDESEINYCENCLKRICAKLRM